VTSVRAARWRQAGAGGLLLAAAVAANAQEQSVARSPAARVRGTVYDSMAMRPLTGAIVQLALIPSAGTIASVRSISTDTLGRFDFAGVLPGTYLLGFQHVAVDSLGLRGPLQRIDVRTASAIRASLAVPSMKAIITTVCGREGAKDSLAVLLGSIRHARTDTAIPGAFLSLRWGEVILGRDGSMQRSTPIVDAWANDEGWFTACVPGGVPMTVRAAHGTDLSGDVELGVPARAVLRRDLYVGPAEAEARPADTTESGRPVDERIIERGRGALRGVVRALDGGVIEGARVALLNGATEARTNAEGEFVLRGVPYGSHTIEARAIGFVPGQVIADIVEFRDDTTEFTLLDVSAYLLDTVRVAAVRRLDAVVRDGIERRRRTGSGYFIDESVLDTMKAFSFQGPGTQDTRHPVRSRHSS
jgi:hypothetical protein